MSRFLYFKPSSSEDFCHSKNVIIAAARLIKKLINYEEVICCAEMQSGKSEVMRRIVYLVNKYTANINSLGIPIFKNNVYIILCTSSINLKKHLQKKIPEIADNIYHINDIYFKINKEHDYIDFFIKMATSSFIIFDECHCDIELGKIIHQFRKILDKYKEYYDTEYHIIGFSATPYEQMKAGFQYVIMEPGDGYYGIVNMFEKKYCSIFPAKKLYEYNECYELFINEISICDFYYVFRLTTNKNHEDKIFTNMDKCMKLLKKDYETFIYDMNHKSDINNLLCEKPTTPTFIFIKNKLRMGEYLDTKHIHLVHDDPDNLCTQTTVQSLLGRCCGYHKGKNNVIIYCDYENAYQHYLWVKNNYDINFIPNNAKYINKNGEIKKKCMF